MHEPVPIGASKIKWGSGVIRKKDFTKAVLDFRNNPDDREAQKEYVKYVEHLALKLIQWHKIKPEEQPDALQDLVLHVFDKDLHNRVDPDKQVLAFYWQAIKRQIWKRETTKRVRTIKRVPMSNLFSNVEADNNFINNVLLSDNGEGEEEMLRELGFSLDDFEVDVTSIPAVETSAPKRGRPSKKKGKKAAHWELRFLELQKATQLPYSILSAGLPDNLNNPEQSLKTNLKAIAKREGYSLTITNDGQDPVYILSE